MDWRLCASTFAVIFLAELGDKTQLAAMAASAGSKAPWSVFAGASAALVMSTLIATLFGATLQRVIPPHVLKGGAAILFFVFGAVLLVSALRAPRAAVEAVPEERHGALARLTMSIAAEFERAAAADYERWAVEASSPAERMLFEHLAAEERIHARRLGSLTRVHGEATWPEPAAGPAEPAPFAALAGDRSLDKALDVAIAHETDTAAFYRELARTAPLRGVRNAFARLAVEEDSHVEHLQEFKRGGRVVV